jgi:ATP-dependent DNA helicase DinG
VISFLGQNGVSEPDMVRDVRTFFSPEGSLARFKNFEYRPQQQQMAEAVAEALLTKNKLIVEGGTGVGKSLAYLVPAILYATEHKKKAIICTHTINLQEQLIQKDLPLLKKILDTDFTYTMLKGRSNYLCTYRLHRALRNAKYLFTDTEQAELERIKEWSEKTKDGTLSDFAVEPDPKVWSEVCSERGLCSPKVCGHKSDFAQDHPLCFFQKARNRIFTADLLVLNHTLFFINLGLVFNKLPDGVLMNNDFVIFDEAHTLENVASKHIGFSLSSGQYRYALNRLYNPRTQKGVFTSLLRPNEIPHIADALEAGEEFFSVLEEACDKACQATPQKLSWSDFRVRRPNLIGNNVASHLARIRDDIAEILKTVDDEESTSDLEYCSKRITEIQSVIGDFLDQSALDHVYWVEKNFVGRNPNPQLSLHAAPMDIAQYLRERLFGANTSVVLTSATLSMSAGTTALTDQAKAPQKGGSSSSKRRLSSNNRLPMGLEYVSNRLGGESSRLLQVGSPFDFERQVQLYLVNKMPDPREDEYQEKLVEYIKFFVKQTHGKAFVLFTNNQLMRKVAEELEPFFEELDLELYVQGMGLPRSAMLDKFRKNTDSVLFGLDSFWQGVDVPGNSLSNVIITRLPFVAPDHPLTEARLELIRLRGGNPFMEYTLPEAVLKFRQGIGRLIRTQSDHGIVVVLDSRILSKFYGSRFLEAMPKCAVEII